MQYCYQGWFRFLLAVFVLVSHTAPKYFQNHSDVISKFQLGNFAVAGFFVLSGYLMFSAILNVYSGNPERFIINRYLRISLPLFFASVISIFIHFFVFGGFSSDIFSFNNVISAISGAIFPFNFLITKSFGVVDVQYDFVRYIWAVFTELIFYWFVLFLGFSFIIFNVFLRRLVVFSIFSLYIFATVFSIYVNHFSIHGDLLRDVPLIFHFQWGFHFMLGMSMYVVINHPHKLLSVLAMIFCLVGAIFQFCLYTIQGGADFKFYPVLFYVLCVIIIYHICIRENGIEFMGRGVPKHIDQKLGSISYPLYINHFSIFLLLEPLIYNVSDGAVPMVKFIVYVSFVIVTCFLSLLIISISDRVTDHLRDRVRGLKFS
ncbi:MAG: acyltransferase [Pseudomonadota bacterium]|nr:acyltransferase [Pseudomonadota bacterium]